MNNKDKAQICKFFGWPLFVIGIFYSIIYVSAIVLAILYFLNPAYIIGEMIGALLPTLGLGYYLIKKSRELSPKQKSKRKIKFRWGGG